MMHRSNVKSLAEVNRIFMVVLDGSDFLDALLSLRKAGFRGNVRAISHQQWKLFLENKCEKCALLPDNATSLPKRVAAITRSLVGNAKWAEAVVWVNPLGGRWNKLLRVIARQWPVFCFQDGQSRLFAPGVQPGRPSAVQIAGQERELAIKYLRPALRQRRRQKGKIRLGVDGEGVQLREATGIQWYRRHLLAAFCEDDIDIDLAVTYPAVEVRNVWELPWANKLCPIPRTMFNYPPKDRDKAFPIEAITGPVDLFHYTFFRLFPPCKFDKVVATLYDAMPIIIPETYPQHIIDHYDVMLPFWRDECSRVICISEATRRDAVEAMKIPESKLAVIYPGRHPHYYRRDEEEVAAVLSCYGIREPYFLALSSLVPHKNVQALCKAFAIVKKTKKIPHQLVLVGRPGWKIFGILDDLLRAGFASDVVFTGYADFADVPALYSGAEAFCHPSLFEGYGLPVQEAMCCGCPVLLSNCTSLPEVAGDAGIYWNPRDIDSMVDVLTRFVEQDALRAKAREDVLRQAETFPTWHDVALAHKTIYEQVIQNK